MEQAIKFMRGGGFREPQSAQNPVLDGAHLSTPAQLAMRWNIHPIVMASISASPMMAITTSPVMGVAAWKGVPMGPAPGGKRAHKATPPPNVKFNRDPPATGILPGLAWTYMLEYGPEISIEGAKVRCIIMALEGPVTQWMVTFHHDNTLELRNNHFMAALRKQFKDSLAQCWQTF